MQKFLSRLLAYLVAGLTFGPAARLFLVDMSASEGRFSYLTPALLALSGAAVACWLLFKASPARQPGIAINPRWATPAMDAVCLIAAAMAVFFIVDGYGAKVFGLAGGMTDPLVADVIAFMAAPAALILALFVTTTGGQSVKIDASGLTVYGPFGQQHASWQQVRHIRSQSDYVAVSRLQQPVPSKLRTNIEITVGADETMTIYQPGLKSTTGHILARLKQHAPDRLRDDVEQIRF